MNAEARNNRLNSKVLLRNFVPILLLTIVLILAACLPLSAAESGQVLIKADSIGHDQQEEIVSATGKVEY